MENNISVNHTGNKQGQLMIHQNIVCLCSMPHVKPCYITFHPLGSFTQTTKIRIDKLSCCIFIKPFLLSADRSLRARESSLFRNLRFSYIHLSLWNSFGDARWAPGIIVIANPDIIELQSDRATPGAARTITLRPGSQWKSCIREKPQSIRCWKTGKCWQIMCQYQPK